MSFAEHTQERFFPHSIDLLGKTIQSRYKMVKKTVLSGFELFDTFKPISDGET